MAAPDKASKLKYLEKYMSKEDKPKKRRKVAKASKQSNVRIVDEDVDLKDLETEGREDAEEALLATKEDAPIVASVIDERPTHLQGRFKPMGHDGSMKSRKKNDTDSDDSESDSSSSADKKKLRQRHDSDSDASPQKAVSKSENSGSELSDVSPPRRGRARHDSESDQSPPRKKQAELGGSDRKKGQTRHDSSSSDASPPRRTKQESPTRSTQRSRSDNKSDESSKRSSVTALSHKSSRRSEHKVSSNGKQSARSRSDSDASPPRKNRTKSGRRGSDSDQSPVRKRGGRSDSDVSPPRKPKDDADSDSEVVRVQLRDTSKAEKAKAEAEKAAKTSAVYNRWSKGVAQQAEQEARVSEVLHEIAKPLARSADDADLEDHLRSIDREGDPMLAYVRNKKSKEASTKSGVDLPRYRGPEPPPNRYNIWPGYRWDGVDRSNGFEAKLISTKNDKMAREEDAYKWSVEDM